MKDQAPSDLKDCTVPYYPNRALVSLTAGLTVVPNVSKSKIGCRGFTYQPFLRLGFNLSFLIKVVLRIGSGDLEPPLSYAAI